MPSAFHRSQNGGLLAWLEDIIKDAEGAESGKLEITREDLKAVQKPSRVNNLSRYCE